MLEKYTQKNSEKISKVVGNTSYYLALIYALGSIIFILYLAFLPQMDGHGNPEYALNQIIIFLVVFLISFTLLYIAGKNNKRVSKEFIESNKLKSVLAFWSSLLTIFLMVVSPILFFLALIEFNGCGGEWFGCIEYYGPAVIGVVVVAWIEVYLLVYQILYFRNQKFQPPALHS